jgi:hypothetical protein
MRQSEPHLGFAVLKYLAPEVFFCLGRRGEDVAVGECLSCAVALHMSLSKPCVSEVSRSIIDFVKEAESRSGVVGNSGPGKGEIVASWRFADL